MHHIHLVYKFIKIIFYFLFSFIECGGKLKADFSIGFVYSHARYGDRKYPKLAHCIWEIYAEIEYGIKIKFTQLDIEKENTCEYDYIAVYDGFKKHNELLIGKFCGDDVSNLFI